jgi:hypothetical protein
MKKLIFVSGATFAITLAVVIGVRLSPDAMAVVVGIVAGVLASVPMSAVLVWTLRVRDRQLEAQFSAARGYGQGQYPPVVVVNGQGGHSQPAGPSLLTATPGPRQFKVVGQENTENGRDTLSPIWDEL